MMKKVTLAVLALVCAGSAVAADPGSDFDSKRYQECDIHSGIAVLLAGEARGFKKTAESVQSDVYQAPDQLDVKLVHLAEGAMQAGQSNKEDTLKLQKFLTGICYASGEMPKPIIPR